MGIASSPELQADPFGCRLPACLGSLPKSRFPLVWHFIFIGSAWEARLATLEQFQQFAKHTFKFGGGKPRLAGLEARLIWQYVRHNPIYRAETDALNKQMNRVSDKLTAKGAQDKDISATLEDMEFAFARKWCMSHYQHYAEEGDAEALHFSLNAMSTSRSRPGISSIARQNLAKELWSLGKPTGDVAPSPIILVINPFAHPERASKMVAANLEEQLKKQRKNFPELRKAGEVASNLKAHVVEYLICYHYREVMRQRPREVNNTYRDILGAGYSVNSHQISNKVRVFKKLASAAPWCFLNDFYS